ncbi:MAG: HTH domain-containing protein [Paracoccaceae bacterium]
MRGARLLQILLLLQNRGRMTSRTLAAELEVTPRTVLRDLDAMTEAGLPVIAFQGSGGGIELGFDYRSQMTALTHDEAEALALMLAHPHPALRALERDTAAKRAAGKIIEAQAAPIRAIMARTLDQFSVQPVGQVDDDPRPIALARAVRGRNLVTLRARDGTAVVAHPTGLRFDMGGWVLTTPRGDIAQTDWGDVVISAKTFDPA